MHAPASHGTDGPATGLQRVWERVWWLVFLALCATLVVLWRRDPALAGRAFASLFVALSLPAFVSAWRWLRLARASEGWTPAEATVVRSEIRTETTTDGVGSRRDTMTFVYPEVEFTYEFQGRAHRSDRIVFAQINWPPDQARAWVAAHPVGSRLTVWVDPERPERAVAERGLAEHRGKYVAALAIAGILLALGLAGLVLAPLLRRLH